ncbi:MAG: hypothetical protein ABW153_10690 [Sedimenticola sp.]
MKKMMKLFVLPLLLIGVHAGQVSVAAPSTVQFSADTYQKGQNGQESMGKIYVGDGMMRTEMQQSGQQVIQIMDTKRQAAWVLYPAHRSYMEMSGGSMPANQSSGAAANPCQGLAGAQCRKLGQESVSGRAATKWEVNLTQQGKSYQSYQWLDNERGLVLRQESSGGRSELKLLGMEKLEGRTVEKWEMNFSQGKQPAQRSYRWFDPELNLAVREEFPGGFVREMKNIRVAPQDPSLFTLPAGYKKITPQQGRPARR